jgi:phosphoribosylanthranilate isomerase
MRTRAKICGIRETEHALCAAEHGADAIGLVFHAPSPRAVTAAAASRICGALPPFVTTVGLFVNATPESVRAILAEVPLDLLQFHGDETPAQCAAFGRPWMRAVRVGPGTDLLKYALEFNAARALLLDADIAGEFGGTGRSFDWSVVPRPFPLPVVLSGGLTPDNVGEAIAKVRPWAVDVSSGVEVSRGVKDCSRIEAFLRSVRNAAI